jgi:hypothetical protein
MTDVTLLDPPTPQDASHSAVPKFDPAKYAPHLEGLALTEAQARVFLETLWSLMIGFVDLGGVDSVQQILADRRELSSEFGANAVEKKDTQHAQKFNDAATHGGETDSEQHD